MVLKMLVGIDANDTRLILAAKNTTKSRILRVDPSDSHLPPLFTKNMLKFSESKDGIQKQCTPNILPCRIHHDGPVDASPRYWTPETAKGQSSIASRLHSPQTPVRDSHISDSKPEAYFRGRKLRGREIDVPKGYRGVVVQEAGKEKAAVQTMNMGDLDGEEGEEEREEVTVLNEVGLFDKVVIWNHESIVDGDDAFVKGLGEWVGFAQAVSHVFPKCTQRYMYNIADATYRVDACLRSRKDFVKMAKESYPSLNANARE